MKHIPSVIIFTFLSFVFSLRAYGVEALDLEASLPVMEFKSESPLTPYVGAGILPEDQKKKEDYLSVDPTAKVDDGIMYGLAAGIGYDLGNDAKFNVGYCYSPSKLPGFLNLPILPDPLEEDHLLNVNLKLNF